MDKLERNFSNWDEFRQEFESNLKNFGLFLPGEFQLELRKKIQVELRLPGIENPVPARAEVVAIFPAGVALNLEENADWLKQLQEKIPAAAPPEPEPEPTAEPEAGEAGPADKELNALDPEPDSEEEVKAIEKKISLAGMDMSNLYQAVRKLSKLEKISLARRGNRKALSILIQEGDRMLFRFIIQNPHLTAGEVLQMFKHPSITAEIISELSRNASWGQNEEIRYQMVVHPKTSLPLALTLLNGLNQRQLAVIAKSQNLRNQIKSNALKLLLKRQSGAF